MFVVPVASDNVILAASDVVEVDWKLTVPVLWLTDKAGPTL